MAMPLDVVNSSIKGWCSKVYDQ